MSVAAEIRQEWDRDTFQRLNEQLLKEQLADCVPRTIPRLQLDWRSYFHQFMAEHGQPVQIGDQLLFPDGWRYSATDYEGPEYPPPSDPKQLQRLQLSYWRTRKQQLLPSLQEAAQLVRQLESLDRSLPVVMTDPEGEPWDLEDLRELKDQLAADLEECAAAIRAQSGAEH